MGALDQRGPGRQGALRRDLLLLAAPHRGGGPAPRGGGDAAADPPAVVLDAQSLDRDRRPARRARPRGRRCIVFSPLAQGTLTDKYLHGIPEDSRVRRGNYLSEDMISEDRLELIRALNEIASRRGQSLAVGDRLGGAR